MIKLRTLFALMFGALVLVGCGEQPQTIAAKPGQSAAKADDKPYGPGTQFADRKAWEVQLRARAENQNEYKRVN
jgi:uncharacterized lipoprotein YajG